MAGMHPTGPRSNPGLKIDGTPRVVGSVTAYATLQALPAARPAPCDVVEARLDLIGPDQPDWLERCQAIEAAGLPVILTLRLAAEGGEWTGPDPQRLPVLERALRALSAVDVEFASPLRVPLATLATGLGKTLILSHHDFERTPPLDTLRTLFDTISTHAGAIPKIATMVHGPDDIARLEALLDHARPRPLCLIGMGPIGAPTRVTFAARGSCLTYGFLDRECAPGQWSAPALMAAVRDALGATSETRP